ncbi:MAG: CapA family protein [Verrucomicrobiota bacterium]
MRIALFGDICPQPNATIDPALQEVDLVLGNLESPVADANAPSAKTVGPSLRAESGNFQSFAAHFDTLILTLANNHTMDFGPQGLESTLAAAAANSVRTVGAHKNLAAAKEPLIVDTHGIRIGFLGRCETQFGQADQNRSGVAILDATIYETVARLKADTDFVFVSVHGASEFCPWPSPQWQDTLRSLVDAGADVVHGHHAHIPQGFENYNDGWIFYSLGNFLVNPTDWSHLPNGLWSTCPIITLTKQTLEVDLQTSVICHGDNNTVIRPSSQDEQRLHFAYLERHIKPLRNREFLEGLWQEFSLRITSSHYGPWIGLPLAPPKARVRLKTLLKQIKRGVLSQPRSWISRKQRNAYLNLVYHLFACESHRSAVVECLALLTNEKPDKRNKETREWVDELILPME